MTAIAANPDLARSIQYHAKGGVTLIETDVRDPGPGEVQVRATACGICAWDVFVYKHGFGDGGSLPGHEGVARIQKVGPGVHWLHEGQRVTGHGLGFTEVANVPAHQMLVLPEDGRPDEHWIVEPVSCVVTGLDHCRLKAGDRVAVVGCGFMGLMLLQALGRSFADEVVAIDLDPARLEMARKFGATRTHNPADPDFESRIIPELQGLGLDTVVDCSGAQAGLDLSSKIVRSGGCLNLFGWNHGRPQFPGDLWHMNGLTVVNSAPNSAIRNPWPPAIRLIERGIIDLAPLVTHVVPLDAYPALLETAAARDGGYIKGVVRLGE